MRFKKVAVTPVFQRLYNAFCSKKYKQFVLQGGMWSGKTRSITDLLTLFMLEPRAFGFEDKAYACETLSMTQGIVQNVMEDFVASFDSLLHPNDVVITSRKGDTPTAFKIRNSTMQATSFDQPQKAKGRKMDWGFFNEADGISRGVWLERYNRYRYGCFYDYNPTKISGYHYELAQRPDAWLDISTYKDNPFTPEHIVDEILSWEFTNPNRYRIHALGQQGVFEGAVYPIWKKESFVWDREAYALGVDFGQVHPTAICLLGASRADAIVRVKEIFYRSHVTPVSYTHLTLPTIYSV